MVKFQHKRDKSVLWLGSVKKSLGSLLVLVLVLCGVDGRSAYGMISENKSTAASNLAITIYSRNQEGNKGSGDGVAAIHEVRNLNLQSGENKVSIDGLSSSILPESFFIHVLNPKLHVQILEQTFFKDEFSLEKLLNKSVGKIVYLRETPLEMNRAKFRKARLRTVIPQILIEEEGTVFSVTPDQLVFPEQVSGSNRNPYLSVVLESLKTQVVPVEVNYLTKGLEWSAYYIGELNMDESSLNIDGWVAICNNTDGIYNNAYVQLSAFNPLNAKTQMHDPEAALLYRMEKPITLVPFLEKKVRLFRIINLPLTLEYRLRINQDFSQNHLGQEVTTSVEKWGKLERPLEFRDIIPEGQLRLYKRNDTAAIEFLGETRLKERGGGNQIPFLIGQAKEIKVTEMQTDFRKLYHNVYESGFLYKFLNKSDVPLDLTISLKLPGEGKLLKESQSHMILGEDILQWTLSLPPQKIVEFRFRVRIPVTEGSESVSSQT